MISSERSDAGQGQDTAAVDEQDRAGRADDDAIRALVVRLSRAHPSGGRVIERAAILASGVDLDAVVRWIAAHAGQPEATAPAPSGRGLHATHVTEVHPPRRYVLPAGALD